MESCSHSLVVPAWRTPSSPYPLSSMCARPQAARRCQDIGSPSPLHQRSSSSPPPRPTLTFAPYSSHPGPCAIGSVSSLASPRCALLFPLGVLLSSAPVPSQCAGSRLHSGGQHPAAARLLIELVAYSAVPAMPRTLRVRLNAEPRSDVVARFCCAVVSLQDDVPDMPMIWSHRASHWMWSNSFDLAVSSSSGARSPCPSSPRPCPQRCRSYGFVTPLLVCVAACRGSPARRAALALARRARLALAAEILVLDGEESASTPRSLGARQNA